LCVLEVYLAGYASDQYAIG